MSAEEGVVEGPPYIIQLSRDLGGLTAEVIALTKAVNADQIRRAEQRSRDWKINLAIIGTILALIAAQWFNVHRQNSNKRLAKTGCESVNNSLQQVHDLLAPFLVPQVEPTFQAMTPAEKQAVVDRNKAQVVGLKAFQKKLEELAEDQKCG